VGGVEARYQLRTELKQLRDVETLDSSEEEVSWEGGFAKWRQGGGAGGVKQPGSNPLIAAMTVRVQTPIRLPGPGAWTWCPQGAALFG